MYSLPGDSVSTSCLQVSFIVFRCVVYSLNTIYLSPVLRVELRSTLTAQDFVVTLARLVSPPRLALDLQSQH